MADLNDLGNLAEIISGALVVGGLAFTVMELRRNREQSRREAAFQIFNNMGSQEFIHGLKVLAEMPDQCMDNGELRQEYQENFDELYWVLFQFENLATMVEQDMVPMDLALSFYGISIPTAWRKMGPYLRKLREERQEPLYFIYLEWLAQKIEDRKAALVADR